MNPKRVKLALGIWILMLFLVVSIPLRAQIAEGTLSGTVTGTSEKVVPNAKISVKNVATGQSAETQSNAAGFYSVANLAPGNYDVSVSAEGFTTQETKVTLAAGATQTMNLVLTPALSLQDLGSPSAETRGSIREQALLNKRSHMLQIHQRLGLLTTIPLAATVISGAFAGGKPVVTSSTDRDLHAALGTLTASMYFTSAFYAILAPKVPGTKVEGPIRIHKALAWIHFPGMILTPILGEMAFAQRSNGERVHGIARAHNEVAIITLGAYVAAILSVSIKSGSVSRSAHHVLAIFHKHRSISADASRGNAGKVSANIANNRSGVRSGS